MFEHPMCVLLLLSHSPLIPSMPLTHFAGSTMSFCLTATVYPSPYPSSHPTNCVHDGHTDPPLTRSKIPRSSKCIHLSSTRRPVPGCPHACPHCQLSLHQHPTHHPPHPTSPPSPVRPSLFNPFRKIRREGSPPPPALCTQVPQSRFSPHPVR